MRLWTCSTPSTRVQVQRANESRSPSSLLPCAGDSTNTMHTLGAPRRGSGKHSLDFSLHFILSKGLLLVGLHCVELQGGLKWSLVIIPTVAMAAWGGIKPLLSQKES